MKVSRADIKKNLPQKGFKKKKFGHHIYFHHEHNRVETGIKNILGLNSQRTPHMLTGCIANQLVDAAYIFIQSLYASAL
jgi:ribosomal protein S7